MRPDVDQPAFGRGRESRGGGGQLIEQRIKIVERIRSGGRRCWRGWGGGNLPAVARPCSFKPREKIGIIGDRAAATRGLDMVTQAIEREQQQIDQRRFKRHLALTHVAQQVFKAVGRRPARCARKRPRRP
jgi:hypothetical protein